MIRRYRKWTMTVALAASLLPGCLSDRSNTRKDAPGKTELPGRGEVSGLQGPPKSSYDQRETAGTDRTPPDIVQTAGPTETPAEPAPPAGVSLSQPRPQMVQPPPASPEPERIQQVAVTPPRREEPLLASLRSYQERKPAQALEQLRQYNPPTRELLALLLPLAARIGEIRLEQARGKELALHLERIDSLLQELRPKAALMVGEPDYCGLIKGFGQYEPLPKHHVFCYGNPVQVYVELHNLTSRRNGPYHETVLTRKVSLYAGQDVAAGRKHHPDVLLQLPTQINRSRSPRRDWYLNCSFYVPPNLPVGTYTLVILIQDVTEVPPGAPVPEGRTREFSLPFHVGPRSTGLVSAAEQGVR